MWRRSRRGGSLFWPTALALTCALGFASVLVLSEGAQATHMRGAMLANEPDKASLTVTFTGWWSERNDGKHQFITGSQPGPSIDFGDGNSSATTLVYEEHDDEQNWWRAKIVGPDGNPLRHTYSDLKNDTKPWQATITGCCRLDDWSNGARDAHVNNANELMIVHTSIDFEAGASPVSNIRPVSDCVKFAKCVLDMEISANGAYTSRLPKRGEAAEDVFINPGPPFSSFGASVQGGNWVWNTQNVHLPAPGWNYYSAHVVLRQGDSTTAVDFMVRIISGTLVWDETESSCRMLPMDRPRNDENNTWPPYQTSVYPYQTIAQHYRALSLLPGYEIHTIDASLPPAMSLTYTVPGEVVDVTTTWTPTLEDVGVHALFFIATGPAGDRATTCLGILEVLPLEVLPKIQFEPGGRDGDRVRFSFTDIGRQTQHPNASVTWFWHMPDGATLSGQNIAYWLREGEHNICLSVTLELYQAHVTEPTCANVIVVGHESDVDRDGVADHADNCPQTPNRDQRDSNDDGKGDACQAPAEAKQTEPGAVPSDRDGDSVPDSQDNCVEVPNPEQLNLDWDAWGDDCDDDLDGDRIPQIGPTPDNCPWTINPLQEDIDGDGLGDWCDHDSADANAPRNSSLEPMPASLDAGPVAMARSYTGVLWMIGAAAIVGVIVAAIVVRRAGE